MSAIVAERIPVTCATTSLEFMLTQSGNRFSGAQSGTGRITCFAHGDIRVDEPFGLIIDEPIDSETITEGTISGFDVSFQLGSMASQHIGIRSSTSLSGSATWQYPGDGLTLRLEGRFTAERL
jgi:hypothetical protein